MQYQTINPFTEEIVKTFPNHTDAQLQESIARAEAAYQNEWRLRTLTKRKTVLQEGSGPSPREA